MTGTGLSLDAATGGDDSKEVGAAKEEGGGRQASHARPEHTCACRLGPRTLGTSGSSDVRR